MSEISQIQQHFTRSAARFDGLYLEEAASPFARWLNRKFRRDILERFRLSLEHVQKYRLKSILDVGCGSGRYEFGLAHLGIEKVVGIDVSPAMIRLAADVTSKLENSSTLLEFRNQDFNQFRTSETFDAVLAMGFFDYVKDPAPALARMRDLATHSVIASFPSISWYRTPIRKVRYLFMRCPVYFYRSRTIQLLGQKAGFQRIELSKIEGAGQDYFVAFFK
jgi:SAM-dependent methyltransferase